MITTNTNYYGGTSIMVLNDLNEVKVNVTTWLEKLLGTNWKTITGGFLIIGSVVVDLMGSHTAAKAVMDAGLGLSVVGIGHKLQRL
jgi:hypothetical protein